MSSKNEASAFILSVMALNHVSRFGTIPSTAFCRSSNALSGSTAACPAASFAPASIESWPNKAFVLFQVA